MFVSAANDALIDTDTRGGAADGNPGTPAYAELHCVSNFTFLRGASSAKELFQRAKAQGYSALAITDEASLAGIVRAYEASKESGLKLIVGAEFQLTDGPKLVLLVQNLVGYSALSALITQSRRAAEKGSYSLARTDVENAAREGLLALLIPTHVHGRKTKTRKTSRSPLAGDQNPPRSDSSPTPATHDLTADLRWLHALFPARTWLAVELHRGVRDTERLERLCIAAAETRIPMVAAGDVHMHVRARRALQDTVTAIRLNTTVAQAGFALFPNGEHHLRKRDDLARIYNAQALAESVRIAASCTFMMDELKYRYPSETVPAGFTPAAYLRQLTEEGLVKRWPTGPSAKVRKQIDAELDLITELNYESYFLTVYDIVRYAREKNILCQGRGSAANSSVCYALGITEVNTDIMSTLFGRFISKERNEPPDIDVDFEHERREEVIQYVYNKYGRHRAALAATVICYRLRSAVRDVGKALGMSADQIDQIAGALEWWDGESDLDDRMRDRGFDLASPVIRRLLFLARELQDFPRHLSQHVGGFVISDRPLHELVPIENAAMPDRTIIQWDKDDLDSLRLLKVDCLALGMLTCLGRCFTLLERHRGLELTLATIPQDDKKTYEMIQAADTLGVFQIESRAQMSMLPRLRPENFYDLVIEVAIVRPGPIQGKMVHPYLRRRQGKEQVDYPNEALREVFARTLGIPIFQEQVMQFAIVAANFTTGEADDLRRSMAAWKRRGGLEPFQQRLRDGMRKNGYSDEFAERIFEQIKGFGAYGFPESHAASFALLVYVSSWIKCHHPAIFACALLNSLPMGFYAPAQIIQDVRNHDVEVRPVDVMHSAWHCTIEYAHGETLATDRARKPLALRLGLTLLRGISEDCANRIAMARSDKTFTDVQDLVVRAQLNRFERTRLADGGALQALAGNRYRAHWDIAAAERMPPVLEGSDIVDAPVALPEPSVADNVFADYAQLGFSLNQHPMSLIRSVLAQRKTRTSAEIRDLASGTRIRCAGLVTVRQRPGTASGVTFVTLEDETGIVNIVVWLALAQKQRRVLVESTVLAVDGVLEKADGVQHLIAHRLHDYSALLRNLDARSRDFH